MDLDALASQALHDLPPGIRARFADHPQAAIDQLGLTVRPIEVSPGQRGGAGSCDGMSFLADGVILYARTPHSRRENFTLAHEVGHFLVDRNDDVYVALADASDPALLLETVCDRIAAQLLMPRDAVDTALGGGPVRAQALLDLHEHTRASRQVCAIALAQRLPCPGAVALIRDGRVAFASTRPDPVQGWPVATPRNGQPVPAGHPLNALASGGTTSRRSFWRTPWDAEERYYLDAVHDGTRIIAVLADRDLWNCERLHLDEDRSFDPRPLHTVTCCGTTREVRSYPCPTCGSGQCSTCGQCRCEKNNAHDRPCQKCFVLYRPHLLVNGRCEDCR